MRNVRRFFKEGGGNTEKRESSYLHLENMSYFFPSPKSVLSSFMVFVTH